MTSQEVRAEGGFAYGAVGADIHVFGDTGTPVYLLFAYRKVSGLDPDWLRAQPSRMLDARAEVVDFTGRDAESGELTAWRESPPRFAVRWLHGPGGQGKTRLAARLAADSEAAGWKVVTAVHGTDTSPPAEGSQDLRLDGHAGVLLLVDYADRWPASHLSWLFHNRLLRQDVPARVLLIGRSAHGWPAIRGQLNRLRENVDTSDQELRSLSADGDERRRMFTTARSCFAAYYPQAVDADSIPPPGPLDQTDFGLTLAVQMAALVAVDARAHGRRPPEDMAGLSAYLLDREHENWRQLYENGSAGLPHRTPDQVMARAVFTAVLTGPVTRAVGRSVLGGLVPEAPADELLGDHAGTRRPHTGSRPSSPPEAVWTRRSSCTRERWSTGVSWPMRSRRPRCRRWPRRWPDWAEPWRGPAATKRHWAPPRRASSCTADWRSPTPPCSAPASREACSTSACGSWSWAGATRRWPPSRRRWTSTAA